VTPSRETIVSRLPLLQAEPFSEGGARWYGFADGRRYPSVSSVVGLLSRPALEGWRLRQALEAARQTLMAYLGRPLQPETVDLAVEEALRRPDALRDGAARWGTGVHRYLETGDSAAAPPHLRPGLRAAQEFIEGLRPLARYPEWLLASDSLRVAGRTDLAMFTSKGWVVLDVKTGQVRTAHLLQLGGYAACIQEVGGPVTAAYVLRLPRDGRPFEAHPVHDLARWQEAFACLARLFWLLRDENGAEKGP